MRDRAAQLAHGRLSVPAVLSLVGPRIFWPSRSWQREPRAAFLQQAGRLVERRPGFAALAPALVSFAAQMRQVSGVSLVMPAKIAPGATPALTTLSQAGARSARGLRGQTPQDYLIYGKAAALVGVIPASATSSIAPAIACVTRCASHRHLEDAIMGGFGSARLRKPGGGAR